MKQMMNLFYEFDKASVYDIHEVNSSFASGSLKVLYLGENRNGSSFTKAAVERALPSLKNVPIVCHWDYESGQIGGHDMELVSTDDGGLRIRNLTEPCGVVPDHAKFRFSIEEDENGIEHEYLIIDGVLLWKRQDVYKHIVDDLGGKVKHSMEINVTDGHQGSNGYFAIDEFEFTALCLLESCDPCFQGSEVELYSAAAFKKQMEQMMAELKECYSLLDTPEEKGFAEESLTEGGNMTLDNDIETIEEVVEEFADVQNEENVEQVDSGENATETPAEDTESFALTRQIVDELERVLRDMDTVDTPWGPSPRYWYHDCDFDLNEVYCFDEADWLLYGFSYSANGDAITIDADSKKRMKVAIVDFEGEYPTENRAFAMTAFMEQASEAFSRFTGLEQQLADATAQIAAYESELQDLRAYKSNVEAAVENERRTEILERFSDLNGIEEFEALRDVAADYTTEELEEKCYAIRGRNLSAAKFSLETKVPKIVVSKQSDNNDEPYGGIVARYAIHKN